MYGVTQRASLLILLGIDLVLVLQVPHLETHPSANHENGSWKRFSFSSVAPTAFGCALYLTVISRCVGANYLHVPKPRLEFLWIV